MNEQQTISQPRKIGSFRRSWMIAKSAWKILTLDKEIVLIPIISAIIATIVAIIGFVGGLLLSSGGSYSTVANSNSHANIPMYAVWAITAALLALLSSYTLAAMIGIVLKRLRGGDPTLGDGIKAIKKNFISLTIFSLFSFGIVQALQFLERRLPFVGAIIAFLGEVAWGVASFFAIPLIIDADESTGPIKATEKSLSLIRKTWKEAGISQFALGLAILLIVLLVIIIGIGAGAALWASLGASYGIAVGILLVPILLLTVLVSSALTGIARAVLYYYAITGEAPAEFDKRLLQEAFTPKKARKIFA